MKIPEQIQEAIQAYYAERATDKEIAALEAWFRADIAHVKVFAEHGMVEWQLLCEQEKLDAAAVLTMLREAEESAEPDFSLLQPDWGSAKADSFGLRETWTLACYFLSKGLHTKAARSGAIAAGLVLMLGLVVLFFATQQDDGLKTASLGSEAFVLDEGVPAVEPVYVAQVLDTYSAVWASSLDREGRLQAGTPLVLTQGFAEVQFADGATLLLQAPAVFEPLGSNAVRLLEGRLTADVPESAHGFEIATPYMHLTDLGTAFGVEVDSDQAATDAYVFTGLVQVRDAGAVGPDTVPIDLHPSEGASGRQDAGVQRSEVNPSRFTTTMAMAPYAVEASDTVRFLQEMPASLVNGALESNDWLHLVLERAELHVPEAIAVSFTEPGRYDNFNGQRIGLDRPVDSYLAHFDPVGRDDPVYLTGEITFPRPVVAVIGGNWQLKASDRRFARPGVQLDRDSSHSIGLDGRSTRGITPDQIDVLELSEDRRTIRFRLHALYPFDEFRVLIEAYESSASPEQHEPKTGRRTQGE